MKFLAVVVAALLALLVVTSLADAPEDLESLDELEVRGREGAMKVWALRPVATVPGDVPAAEPNPASS